MNTKILFPHRKVSNPLPNLYPFNVVCRSAAVVRIRNASYKFFHWNRKCPFVPRGQKGTKCPRGQFCPQGTILSPGDNFVPRGTIF